MSPLPKLTWGDLWLVVLIFPIVLGVAINLSKFFACLHISWLAWRCPMLSSWLRQRLDTGPRTRRMRLQPAWVSRADQLLYLISERVAFFRGVVDRSMVLTVLVAIDIGGWRFFSGSWKCVSAEGLLQDFCLRDDQGGIHCELGRFPLAGLNSDLLGQGAFLCEAASSFSLFFTLNSCISSIWINLAARSLISWWRIDPNQGWRHMLKKTKHV